MLSPKDVFPKFLSAALKARGQYVYAYYEPGCFVPFYVGKGSKNRVLDHWNNAIKSPTKKHEEKIVEILKRGEIPHICLLAYNLDASEEDRHSIAERVLQDAFGIQHVIEKTLGSDRLVDREGILLQKREDSASRRPISLQAVLAMYEQYTPWSREKIVKISTQMNEPILLVGLSKTYHSAYQECHLKEMARMYWNLENFENTKLPFLLDSKKAILVAWASKLTGNPAIVGVWRIDGTRANKKHDRYEFPATSDLELYSEFLGQQLLGTGNNWQGPSIFTPIKN